MNREKSTFLIKHWTEFYCFWYQSKVKSFGKNRLCNLRQIFRQLNICLGSEKVVSDDHVLEFGQHTVCVCVQNAWNRAYYLVWVWFPPFFVPLQTAFKTLIQIQHKRKCWPEMMNDFEISTTHRCSQNGKRSADIEWFAIVLVRWLASSWSCPTRWDTKKRELENKAWTSFVSLESFQCACVCVCVCVCGGERNGIINRQNWKNVKKDAIKVRFDVHFANARVCVCGQV